MKYHILGKTKLKVSKLSLGTAGLLSDYSINKVFINKKSSLKLIRFAFSKGINFFDTAESYKFSEKFLYEALKKKIYDCVISSKFDVSLYNKKSNKKIFRKKLLKFLKKSKKNLRKNLDILYLHNPTYKIFGNKDFFKILNEFKGKYFNYLGASIYNKKEVLEVIKSKEINVIQIPYNLFNKEIDDKVCKLAKVNGIGIVVRSVFLKGLLTSHFIKHGKFKKYIYQVLKFNHKMKIKSEQLSKAAIRFCYNKKYISSIVLGSLSTEEIKKSISSIKKKRCKCTWCWRFRIYGEIE